jgi:hypothetical protein
MRDGKTPFFETLRILFSIYKPIILGDRELHG